MNDFSAIELLLHKQREHARREGLEESDLWTISAGECVVPGCIGELPGGPYRCDFSGRFGTSPDPCVEPVAHIIASNSRGTIEAVCEYHVDRCIEVGNNA